MTTDGCVPALEWSPPLTPWRQLSIPRRHVASQFGFVSSFITRLSSCYGAQVNDANQGTVTEMTMINPFCPLSHGSKHLERDNIFPFLSLYILLVGHRIYPFCVAATATNSSFDFSTKVDENSIRVIMKRASISLSPLAIAPHFKFHFLVMNISELYVLVCLEVVLGGWQMQIPSTCWAKTCTTNQCTRVSRWPFHFTVHFARQPASWCTTRLEVCQIDFQPEPSLSLSPFHSLAQPFGSIFFEALSVNCQFGLFPLWSPIRLRAFLDRLLMVYAPIVTKIAQTNERALIRLYQLHGVIIHWRGKAHSFLG